MLKNLFLILMFTFLLSCKPSEFITTNEYSQIQSVGQYENDKIIIGILRTTETTNHKNGTISTEITKQSYIVITDKYGKVLKSIPIDNTILFPDKDVTNQLNTNTNDSDNSTTETTY